MSGTSVRQEIHETLNDIAVVDPHTHLRPGRPAARDVADIVLYHHVWIELVSAGMPQAEVSLGGLPQELEDPGMTARERVRRALPWLPRISNTTGSGFLRVILRDLFGWDREWAETDADQLADRVDAVVAREGWSGTVLRDRCGIATSISVDKSKADPAAGMLLAGEELGFVNLHSGKRTPRQVLDGMGEVLGREIRSAADLRDCIDRVLAACPWDRYAFLGAWVDPRICEEYSDPRSVTETIRRARRNAPLDPQRFGGFAYHGMAAALERLRAAPLRTIQLIAGAEVLPPHRSITQWGSGFPGAVGRLANRFPEFRFNMSTASQVHMHDIAMLAKHIPNVSVAGYWWHTLYPRMVREALETRLDAVPASKIVAFFSDAYSAEWCYPKLRMVKGILEDILVERVLEDRYTPRTAAAIAKTVLWDAPREIYGLKERSAPWTPQASTGTSA